MIAYFCNKRGSPCHGGVFVNLFDIFSEAERRKGGVMSNRWTEDQLTAYRQIGDIEVDKLVGDLIPKSGSESIGRLGYNYMVQLADEILDKPELVLSQKSQLSQHLRDMPQNLVDYYDPMEVPDWVDPEKFKIASRLWTENTLACVAALYAASLPACYLIKRGIPALYQSQKLLDDRYIYQRVYETSLFLDAVMEPDGLKIIEDTDTGYEKLVVETLNAVDQEGQWKQDGGQIRSMASGREPIEIDLQRFQEKFEQARGKRKRFVWGKGYITAKKVRFLHASMRYMLTQPHKVQPFGDRENPKTLSERLSQREKPWASEEQGVPVNQEDLAYTLLTFGLLVPEGLEKFGIHVSRAEKEAVLHLWRLVGHILGIRSELMTDNLDEARALFAMIQKRQAESSENGIALTRALMGFFDDYLPHIPGIANRLSATLMIQQLGLNQAEKIIPKDIIHAARVWWRQAIYGFLGLLVRTYFTVFARVRRRAAKRIHEASEVLIESWRGAFIRKPFFVPLNATTWIRQSGADPAFEKKLRGWRLRVFRTIAFGILFIAVSIIGIGSSLALYLYSAKAMWTALGIGVVAEGIYKLIFDWKLPAILRDRPQPKDRGSI
jgi:hypothetical protein